MLFKTFGIKAPKDQIKAGDDVVAIGVSHQIR